MASVLDHQPAMLSGGWRAEHVAVGLILIAVCATCLLTSTKAFAQQPDTDPQGEKPPAAAAPAQPDPKLEEARNLLLVDILRDDVVCPASTRIPGRLASLEAAPEAAGSEGGHRPLEPDVLRRLLPRQHRCSAVTPHYANESWQLSPGRLMQTSYKEDRTTASLEVS